MSFRTIQIVLASVVLLIMASVWIARRKFNLQSRVTEEQRKRFQRTSNVNAGLQFILLGLAIPIGYVLLKTMLFSEFALRETLFVAAGSLACIITGITGIIRNR